MILINFLKSLVIFDSFAITIKLMQEKSEKPEEGGKADNKSRSLGNYAKYTGIAFQMMAIIGGFALAGYKLDQWYDHQKQWITAIACVLGVCLSIYQVIRQLKQ